eukprot:3011618-Prymnesium_polylepis.1
MLFKRAEVSLVLAPCLDEGILLAVLGGERLLLQSERLELRAACARGVRARPTRCTAGVRMRLSHGVSAAARAQVSPRGWGGAQNAGCFGGGESDDENTAAGAHLLGDVIRRAPTHPLAECQPILQRPSARLRRRRRRLLLLPHRRGVRGRRVAVGSERWRAASGHRPGRSRRGRCARHRRAAAAASRAAECSGRGTRAAAAAVGR